MIARRFSESGDVLKAWELAVKSDGILQTKQLAETHCKEAIRHANMLPDSEYRRALCAHAENQITRQK